MKPMPYKPGAYYAPWCIVTYIDKLWQNTGPANLPPGYGAPWRLVCPSHPGVVLVCRENARHIKASDVTYEYVKGDPNCIVLTEDVPDTPETKWKVA